MPSYLLVGDDPARVTLANHAEDSFAVKTRGVRTGPRLEVVGEAASGGVVDLAKWAEDVGATVCL